MHITLEADYAIRIVCHLAKTGVRCDANNVSVATGVSLRFSLKILRNLVANSIAKSFKGTLGGYELNMAPAEITLRQVLEAVEGEYVFSRCLGHETGHCCTNPNHTECRVQAVFSEISEQVKASLEKVTIAHLVRPD